MAMPVRQGGTRMRLPLLYKKEKSFVTGSIKDLLPSV